MKRLLFVSLCLIPATLFAQVPFRWSAKFVCGKPTAAETGALAIASGAYFTAINVHNLSTNPNASLKKRFSYGNISEKPGAVSGSIGAALLPGQTLLIDCHEILSNVGTPPFAEGIVEIIANTDLDVIGVYTTATGSTGVVMTMEIDRVPRR